MPGVRGRFLRAIIAGDFPQALLAAQQAREQGLAYLYEELVAGALAEVGRLWQAGKLSIAEEHIATAVAQSVLASFYPAFPWSATGPRAIVACVEGERHELGARMAADLLAWEGWNVSFVGADVPFEAVLDHAARISPVFVGFSAALPKRIPALRQALVQLRHRLPQVKVLVGGRATTSTSAAELGADLLATSASEATHLIRGWTP